MDEEEIDELCEFAKNLNLKIYEPFLRAIKLWPEEERESSRKTCDYCDKPPILMFIGDNDERIYVCLTHYDKLPGVTKKPKSKPTIIIDEFVNANLDELK